MANEVSSLVGSGTLPFTRNILPVAQRGSATNSRGGHRQATQVALSNPEDVIAVDAWAASGVVLNTTVAQVFGPHINALPRTRMVIIENIGAQDAYIAPTEAGATAADGFTIHAVGTAGELNRIALPLLHNNEVWAVAAASTTTLKIIVY